MTLRDLRRGISFAQMAAGLLFVVFVALAAMMPAQNDTFWHLRAGADIWRTGAVPRVDNYSHTFAGAPWPDHEWLAQALMMLMYRLAGMPGLAISAAALVLATAVVTWRLMSAPLPTRALVMGVGLALSSTVWALRPHMLSLFLMSVLMLLLVHERFRAIPLLFLLWANAHAGVVMGGLVLAAAGAAALLRWWRSRDPSDARRLRLLSIVVALSGLACAATPLGFGIYGFVIESTARSIEVGITEWEPELPIDAAGVMFWLAVVAFVALVVAKRRELRGGRSSSWGDWVAVAGAVALLPLAIRSSRNTGPFELLATIAAGRLATGEFHLRSAVAWLRRRPAPAPVAGTDHPRLNLMLLALAAAGAVAAVGAAFASGLPRLNWRPISDGALAATRACEGPLYNRYDDGGTLIWFVPEKPVFVDGRQDPYPVRFLIDSGLVESGHQPYQPMFERWRIRCAFLPVESKMVAALAADGWATRFKDDKWQVLEAPPAKDTTSGPAPAR